MQKAFIYVTVYESMHGSLSRQVQIQSEGIATLNTTHLDPYILVAGQPVC